MKYTRQDYMTHKCTHRKYYGQFVTRDIYMKVLNQINLKTLLRSTDEHLNDIALKRWDELSVIISTGSLIFKVCVLKEAAKQIIEDNLE